MIPLTRSHCLRINSEGYFNCFLDTGDITKKSLLYKYDEEIDGEKKKAFTLGSTGGFSQEEEDKRKRDEIRAKLANKSLVSLETNNFQVWPLTQFCLFVFILYKLWICLKGWSTSLSLSEHRFFISTDNRNEHKGRKKLSPPPSILEGFQPSCFEYIFLSVNFSLQITFLSYSIFTMALFAVKCFGCKKPVQIFI